MFPVPRRPVHTISVSMLQNILERKSFKNLSGGRRRGQENAKSHYRKGVPGDWTNHLNDEHVRVFRQHYGDLLMKLGYETAISDRGGS